MTKDVEEGVWGGEQLSPADHHTTFLTHSDEGQVHGTASCPKSEIGGKQRHTPNLTLAQRHTPNLTLAQRLLTLLAARRYRTNRTVKKSKKSGHPQSLWMTSDPKHWSHPQAGVARWMPNIRER